MGIEERERDRETENRESITDPGIWGVAECMVTAYIAVVRYNTRMMFSAAFWTAWMHETVSTNRWRCVLGRLGGIVSRRVGRLMKCLLRNSVYLCMTRLGPNPLKGLGASRGGSARGRLYML
jgi:hypothetical protein